MARDQAREEAFVFETVEHRGVWNLGTQGELLCGQATSLFIKLLLVYWAFELLELEWTIRSHYGI